MCERYASRLSIGVATLRKLHVLIVCYTHIHSSSNIYMLHIYIYIYMHICSYILSVLLYSFWMKLNVPIGVMSILAEQLQA